MSAAAQREDRCLAAPETMKGAVVSKAGAKLVKLGFAREIVAKPGAPPARTLSAQIPSRAWSPQSPGGGLPVPDDGLPVVLRHAPPAIAVHYAEVEPRVGVSLVGGLAEPRAGLRVVLRHATPVGLHQAEAELRGGVPLSRA